MKHTRRKAALVATLLALAFVDGTATAQWMRYPSAGLPRLANGKPNLKAPAPKQANGKPDLSGLWGSLIGENRANEPGPAFFNLTNYLVPGSDFTMLPSAEAIYREHRRLESADRPSGQCLPHGIPDAMLVPGEPFKIVHTPGLTLILYEEFARFRQIFTDGRKFPSDLNPGWLGSSVGHWDGNTLVIETRGFNDKSWLDDNGHPHTDALKTTERFRRINIGEMELLITVDDPGAYAKPFTIKLDLRLLPDTDMIEDVCDNEKDFAHAIKK